MSTSLYITQFREIMNAKNWVGLNVESILGLTADQAFRKPIDGKHNIYELLHHITSWRQLLIARLRGDNDYDIELNSETDWPANYDTTLETWRLMIQKFRESQDAIITSLEQIDHSTLEEMVAGRNYNFHRLIQGIIQHDYYHFGQAAQLRA